MIPQFSRIIKLDVGGKIFKTTISTLTKHESMLKTMFSSSVPVVSDENGCIFIDRDSRHFRLILNFLRDGGIALPDSEREVREVLAEAKYFLLDPLAELCEERLDQLNNMYYRVVSTTIEARKYIFASEKPIILLRLPVNIASNGSQCYYFSERRFRELAEQHHKIISFLLITEPELNEDCSWSFFLKAKKLTARIKGAKKPRRNLTTIGKKRRLILFSGLQGYKTNHELKREYSTTNKCLFFPIKLI